MRNPLYVYPVIIVSCLFLMLGCSKKEEPMPAQGPGQQAVPATGIPAGNPQLEKAMSLHKDFSKHFAAKLGKENTLEAMRSQVDLVEKTRVSCMMLRSDVQDPAASDFLVRFTDLLQNYLDLGTRHLSTLEDMAGKYQAAKELESNLPNIPEKDKEEATVKLNTYINAYNEIVQGPSKKEAEELKRLGDELLRLN